MTHMTLSHPRSHGFLSSLWPGNICSCWYTQALAVLDLPPAMEKIVITPQREMTVELIINRDDGKPESFMGYRVQVRSCCGLPWLVRLVPSSHLSAVAILHQLW